MAVFSGRSKWIHFVKRYDSYFLKHAFLSTEAAYAVQNQLPRFRTEECNPALHTRDHVGKFYTMDMSLKKKLFSSGGIPASMEKQIETFREACIMVREPALEVISYLKNINYSHPAVRFVLYGKFGTGKTLSLMHIVHFGYVSKYLLIHAPWISNWTKRPKEIEPSQFREGRIDIPVESTLWLQHFKLQNEELMQELDLKTTKAYTWSVREVTEKGEPLMNVVEHGLQRVRHSSDCVAVLLKEIKHYSQFGKFKVLVVVDGVNAFYNKTNVRRPDKSLVPATDLTIVHAFEKMLKNDWNNAAIVTSIDSIPFNRDASLQDPCTPRFLLGKEGFEVLDPFVPIQTHNYSEKEAESLIDYYCDRLWIQSERARGEEGRKQLKFLSGFHPYTLMKLCDPL